MKTNHRIIENNGKNKSEKTPSLRVLFLNRLPKLPIWRTSLVVQWLRLCTSTDRGLIPSQGTEMLHTKILYDMTKQKLKQNYWLKIRGAEEIVGWLEPEAWADCLLWHVFLLSLLPSTIFTLNLISRSTEPIFHVIQKLFWFKENISITDRKWCLIFAIHS